ncbi:MAG: transporter substrate-binding domain-containing protein, partial [Gluconobacter oxydans]
MKKLFALLLALAISPVSVALADAPAASQELLWASDGEANVPYVFHDPAHESQMTGFEYELVNEIAARMHRKAKFIQNDWDGLIPGLSRGLYGMVLDGIEMTPEHKAAV